MSTSPNSPAAPISASNLASTLDGTESLTASVALMIAIFGPSQPQATQNFNGVAHNLLLLLEIGQHVQAAIGDADQPHLARQRVFVQQHIAEQPAHAHAVLFVQGGAEKFVGAQVSLQQKIHLTVASHLDGSQGRRIAWKEFCFGQKTDEPECLRFVPNLPFVANQDRHRNSETQRPVCRSQRDLVIGGDHRNSSWTKRACGSPELVETPDDGSRNLNYGWHDSMLRRMGNPFQ